MSEAGFLVTLSLDPLVVSGLGMVLCFVVGANNASSCIGTSVGAGAARYSHAIIVASLGLTAGVLLEASKLHGAIVGGLLPSLDAIGILGILLASLTVMVALTRLSIPIALTQVAVGSAIGIGLAETQGINWQFGTIVLVSWLLSPAVAFGLSIIFHAGILRLPLYVRNLLALNRLYAYLTLLSGMYAAYALGANTIGLIIATFASSATDLGLLTLTFAFATVAGMVSFGKGTTRSVAENIVGLSPSSAMAAQLGGAFTVHGFTQGGIPISISQAVVGGVMGVGATKRIVVRNRQLIREILLGWTIAPLSGAALSYVFVQLSLIFLR